MRIKWTSQRLSVARAARIISVVAIAMAAGHVAQTLAAERQVKEVALETGIPTRIILLSAGSTALPSEILERAPEPAPRLAALLETPTAPAPLPAPETEPLAATCPIDLALDAEAWAMIDVILMAPCHAGERVVLRHAGLAVAARLDETGQLAIDLPAFLPRAEIEVMFANGDTVEGVTMIEEAAGLRRFGVQWQGAEAFAVHGFENGADYGQPGHVSPQNPQGTRGSALAVLGDPSLDLPLLAQVFTYPAGEVPVVVVVEAAVTPETCGHDLLGEVIAVEAGRVEVTDLTLAMPECSGVGDFLVLKNLPSEMKLAAN